MNKLKLELNKKPINYNTVSIILDRFIQNIHNLYSVLDRHVIYENYLKSEKNSYEAGENKHFHPKEIGSKLGNYFKNILIHKQNTE